MLHFGLGAEADNEQNMVLQLLILDFIFWSKKIRCKLSEIWLICHFHCQSQRKMLLNMKLKLECRFLSVK